LYQIVEKKDSKALAGFLSRNGQALLPMVELIEQGQMVVEEFIEVMARAALEAVLELSAAQMAGPPHQGKPGGEIHRHGKQPGSVRLSTQRVRVKRPRLRERLGGEGAEVTVPAYEAMQSELGLGQKLCAILMSGVSTRNYERVVPEMAESCGVSKSAVSRTAQRLHCFAGGLWCRRRNSSPGVGNIAVRIDARHILGKPSQRTGGPRAACGGLGGVSGMGAVAYYHNVDSFTAPMCLFFFWYAIVVGHPKVLSDGEEAAPVAEQTS